MSDAEQRDKLDSDELAMYDEYREKLLTNRNEQMVQAAKEYLDGDKTVFYAVGLAHMLGEGGLADALREAGFTVTRINTAQQP